MQGEQIRSVLDLSPRNSGMRPDRD
jgi:hypothetical protein